MSGTFTLRPYQKEASDIAVRFFLAKKDYNAIMVLPTGSGKSLIIADIASRLNAPVLIFQPSKEILEQNYRKLLGYWILDCSIYSASMNRKKINRITFATIGSVAFHPEHFKHFKYVIIDECHLVNSKAGMYIDFITQIGCSVIGLTATPYRLSNDGFGGSILKFLTRTRPRVFSHMIYHVNVSTLARMGYLAKIEYYPVSLVDTTKLQLNTTGADYTDSSVKRHYSAISFNRKLQDVVDRLLKSGRKNVLVFTRFVSEAQELSAFLGDCAEWVSGDTPAKDRERILSDFKSGKIKVVSNVGVLTTGFDFPELETVVIARPTMSLSLYYQMIGRVIRPHVSKPSSWVIDLCQTFQRFGRVETLDIRTEGNGKWAIWNGEKQLTNVYYGKQ